MSQETTSRAVSVETTMSWRGGFVPLGVAIAVTLVACGTSPQAPPPGGGEDEPPVATVSFPEPDPTTFTSTSNRVFHEISWDYFLWLTSEAEDGKLVFETMYTDAAINPESKDDTNHILGGVQQADSEGILVDHNGRAVYTTMMINGRYRDFVLEQRLYEAQALLDFDPDTPFPVGALSLKAAWKIVADGEDTTGMYTTVAEIELLTDDNGSIGIPEDPETRDGVEVALVGFHIAIVVAGHPEAIWATFEHVRNAPYVVGDSQQGDEKVSEVDYTFYAAQTTMAESNVNEKPVLMLDEATQRLTPVTQVALQYRLGGGSSVNQNNIDVLNVTMHSRLPADSIWRNYYEVGAIWFNQTDALNPNWNPESDTGLITGSITLSNSVIETFTQDVGSQNECFSCHNTMSVTTVPPGMQVVPGKNVLTSHILLQKYLAAAKLTR